MTDAEDGRLLIPLPGRSDWIRGHSDRGCQIWKRRGYVERHSSAWGAFQKGWDARFRWTEPSAEQMLQLITHSEVVARISFFFTKFSILLLFLRVFRPLPVRKDKMFYAIWFVIWFNLLYCVALVLAVTLQCVGKKRNPVDACINTFAISTSASTINVSTDIMMLVIPLIEVWNLHMSRRRKLGLSFVFAVGFLYASIVLCIIASHNSTNLIISALASSVARLGWQLHFWNNSNRTARLPKAALLAYVLRDNEKLLLSFEFRLIIF